jgi:hypothetical protein
LNLSTNSSAQRELLPLDEASAQTEAEQPSALKEQVAQRLAAHRARRTGSSPANNSVHPIAKPANTRAARIAATVAERYAHSQSYRAFLAAQAEAAIREAEAAADVAALSARAVADAQYQLLAELDQWSLTPPPEPERLPAPPPAAKPEPIAAAPSAAQNSSPGLTIRLYEDTPARPHSPTVSNQLHARPPFDEDETLALDEEIAFRHAPVFEEAFPPIDIPANLIEFPRQLVAARKARPRLAEGPLREDADETHAPQTTQLRIFEVEAAQISTSPIVESVEPEWSSIRLAAHPVSAAVESPDAPYIPAPIPQAAHLSLRLMASIVDACIVTAAFLLFTAALVLTVNQFESRATSSHTSTALNTTLTTQTTTDNTADSSQTPTSIPDQAATLQPASFHVTSRRSGRRKIFSSLPTPTSPLATSPQAADSDTSISQPSSPDAAVPTASQTSIGIASQIGAKTAAIASLVTLAIFGLIYQLLFFTFSDATPGMRYARIGLCTFADDNPTRSAMRRRILAVLLAACPAGIGFLWACMDEDGLGWHDRISRMYQRSY